MSSSSSSSASASALVSVGNWMGSGPGCVGVPVELGLSGIVGARGRTSRIPLRFASEDEGRLMIVLIFWTLPREDLFFLCLAILGISAGRAHRELRS